MKNTLLLVDGNALLYRAYHAFPKELTDPHGNPIGAVYGFSRVLLSTLKTLKPTCVAVCFDLSGPTFRHKKYPEYKANRSKMPEDLAMQIERTHQVVEYLEFPIYTAEAYEADDVIGTLARQVVENGDTEVTILTGDQDILQLINDQVSVYSPASPPKSPTLFTPKKFEEKYGFKPSQMIEYKALRGDPSDNIPGVPGIGDVSATKLIKEFGTIDNLYQALDEGKTSDIKPAALQKLKDGKENAFLSRDLATITTDAPVHYDESLCKLQLNNPERLITLFKELNFKSLLNDLPVSHRVLSHVTDIFNAEEPPVPETATSTEPLSESEKTDQKLEPVLREMEKRGVKVDCTYLQDLEKEFSTEIEKIKTELMKMSGEEFNPDSPIQVSHILYEVLNIPTTNVRKGKSGFTTDASTLQELEKEYPIAASLLQYRTLTKLLNTYVKPLQTQVDDNSRTHTSYAPDTATGRISSRNPNLQNIPIRSEQGRRLRKAFIAEKGCVLIAADYSQMELRVAAHLSEDPAMIEAFKKGVDFHAETAEKMGIERHIAKALNFSILYGKGAFGFAKDFNVSVAEAKQYIEQYFSTYKELRRYLDDVLVQARQKGYGETLYGRRRPFPNLTSSNHNLRAAAEREAFNMPIQGTQADILKLAMCQLDKELKQTKSQAQLILTVHDELVLEVPERELNEIAVLVKKTMTEIVTLKVPVEVNVKAGSNWGEMKEITG